MIHLDFRTKLLMTAVISYVMMTGDFYNEAPWAGFLCVLIPVVLLLSEKKVERAIRWVVIFGMAWTLQHYFMGTVKGFSGAMVFFFCYLILKMGPGFMMAGYTLYSTSISDMVCALKRGKVPDQVVIPIIVMARFFYTVKEDYRQVKEAMYMNGLTGRRLFRHPEKLLEYRFVPLFMCLSKTADDVSVSAMTRGLQPGRERNSISSARLQGGDFLFFLFAAALLGLHVYLKYVKV